MVTDFSPEALGQAIRELRESREPPLSQDELGRLANYGAGAGVSISRIEAGTNRPSARRFLDIAKVLGVEPSQLTDMARATTSAIARSSDEGREPTTSVRQRLELIQEQIKARTDTIEVLGSAFNEAHELARDQFFLRFVAAADAIAGAKLPVSPVETTGTAAQSGAQATAIAAALAAGAGEAAADDAVSGSDAYATFGGATRGLLGGGVLAMGGRAGAAGSTLLLTGMIVAPIAVLFANGLMLLARRRSAKENAQLCAQLEQSEAAVNATQEGFDALADVLPRATELLDYIGTHAAHALDRWKRGIGSGDTKWEDLTPAQQQRYHDFLIIASCELEVDGIDASAFMTNEGDSLDHFYAAVNSTLLDAGQMVTALV